MKRKLILVAAVLSMLATGCKNSGNGFDTNAAEFPEGDANRKNAQTNAEAGRDTTLRVPEPREETATFPGDTTQGQTSTSPAAKPDSVAGDTPGK